MRLTSFPWSLGGVPTWVREEIANMTKVEMKLLLAICEGQEVVKGEDYETCRRLINAGLVKGIITSNLRHGDSYGALEPTAIGREKLTR